MGHRDKPPANTLTLHAGKDIYVNNTMIAVTTAGLTVTYGTGTNTDGSPMGLYTLQNASSGVWTGAVYFTGTGALKMNNATYTVIGTAAALNADLTNPATYNLAGNYALGLNISTNLTTAVGGTFTGNFNGLGHSLVNGATGSGLFNIIGGTGVVSNLKISGTINPTSTALTALGGLANINYGSVLNSFSSNAVYGANTSVPTGSVTYLGGLVGENFGLIDQSYFYGNVYGTNIVGGLVGLNGATTGSIIDSSSMAYPVVPGTAGVGLHVAA